MFRGCSRKSDGSIRRTKIQIRAHLFILSVKDSPPSRKAVEVPRLRKPERGWSKINVERLTEYRQRLRGVVANDEEWDLLWMWRSHVIAESAADAELQAVHMTLLLVKLKNQNWFSVEGDNKGIMESLAGMKSCPHWNLIPLFKKVLDLSIVFHCLSLVGVVD